MDKFTGHVALLLTAWLPGMSNAMLPSYDFGDCARDLVCRRLPAAELDRLRGGFSFMSGGTELQVSIGISRAVFINDELVAVTQSLLLPTLQQLREGTVAPGSALMGTLTAVSQPATQSTATPVGSAAANGAGAPTAGAAQPVPSASQPSPSTAASGSAGSANALAPTSVPQTALVVNGTPVTPGTPVIVSANELRSLVIQNGPGNVVTPSADEIRAAARATVLQNTLDNQTIRTLTTLSASTNALSAYRESIIREAIGQATTDLLR